jgi:DNA-binding NtrC family response regulator
MEREAMPISPFSENCLATVPPPAQQQQVELVGNSTSMQRLRMQARRIGPHFRSVLVSGEAGTGKELVARALHARGPGGEFVVCGTTELEGVLTECEMTQRGTLFLDGVSEMHLETQDRLLHVLKKHDRVEGRFESSHPRVIAASREDLKSLVSAGQFRQELYQRLATLEIAVPPLRERIKDLPELAECILRRLAARQRGSACEIADDAMDQMRQYRWPGNVRELERVLQDSASRSNDRRIELHHLPKFSEEDDLPSAASKSMRLQDVIEQHTLQVLKDCGGNKLRAAEALGISRSTLYRMLDAGASSISLR